MCLQLNLSCPVAVSGCASSCYSAQQSNDHPPSTHARSAICCCLLRLTRGSVCLDCRLADSNSTLPVFRFGRGVVGDRSRARGSDGHSARRQWTLCGPARSPAGFPRPLYDRICNHGSIGSVQRSVHPSPGLDDGTGLLHPRGQRSTRMRRRIQPLCIARGILCSGGRQGTVGPFIARTIAPAITGRLTFGTETTSNISRIRDACCLYRPHSHCPESTASNPTTNPPGPVST